MAGQPPGYYGGQPPPAYPGQPGGYAPPMGGYAPPMGGYAPPPPGYVPGYGAPPSPAGFAPGWVPAPAFTAPGAQPDRPPKEHCFYIKNSSSQQVVEIENSSVDPGTRLVMAQYQGLGHDGQLWFEDAQTGTIKSRLNLLCLDTQDLSQPHQVLKSPSSVPPYTISLANHRGTAVYSAVAHTQWGSIPGKAQANQCWYSYGGAEYCTADFSWVIAQTPRLVRSTGSTPPGAIGVGHQTDDGQTYYAGIARSTWGTVPGKARGNTCWYGYEGKEHYTNDFDYIVTESNFGVVNPYLPGKTSQLWSKMGNLVQNRQDPSKVIQICSSTRGSLLFSTTNVSDPRQQWTFQLHGAGAPPAAASFPAPVPAASYPAPTPAVNPGGQRRCAKVKKGTHQAQPVPPVPPHRPQADPSLGQLLGKFVDLVLDHKHEKCQGNIRRYFFIRSEMHSKVLDVSGANKKPGTMVVTWPRKGTPEPNQLWYTDDAGIIRSKLHDFVLQPSGHGIWLQPFSKQPNQMWTPRGNKIVLKNNPNICLDISGANRGDGAKICQYKYKGAANQHWALDYI